MLANIFEHVQKCRPTLTCCANMLRPPQTVPTCWHQHVGGNVGQHVGAVCGELYTTKKTHFECLKKTLYCIKLGPRATCLHIGRRLPDIEKARSTGNEVVQFYRVEINFYLKNKAYLIFI